MGQVFRKQNKEMEALKKRVEELEQQLLKKEKNKKMDSKKIVARAIAYSAYADPKIRSKMVGSVSKSLDVSENYIHTMMEKGDIGISAKFNEKQLLESAIISFIFSYSKRDVIVQRVSDCLGVNISIIYDLMSLHSSNDRPLKKLRQNGSNGLLIILNNQMDILKQFCKYLEWSDFQKLSSICVAVDTLRNMFWDKTTLIIPQHPIDSKFIFSIPPTKAILVKSVKTLVGSSIPRQDFSLKKQFPNLQRYEYDSFDNKNPFSSIKMIDGSDITTISVKQLNKNDLMILQKMKNLEHVKIDNAASRTKWSHLDFKLNQPIILSLSYICESDITDIALLENIKELRIIKTNANVNLANYDDYHDDNDDWYDGQREWDVNPNIKSLDIEWFLPKLHVIFTIVADVEKIVLRCLEAFDFFISCYPDQFLSLKTLEINLSKFSKNTKFIRDRGNFTNLARNITEFMKIKDVTIILPGGEMKRWNNPNSIEECKLFLKTFSKN